MKRILLICGAGTLGSYTATELLAAGYHVDCIDCAEKTSYNKNYTYIRGMVDDALLRELFARNRYECIVDFTEYPDWQSYRARGELLLNHTDQLIFLSSYRVYANEQHPITEDAPQIYQVLQDPDVLARESYAIPKSQLEDYLRGSGYHNWTIVRPVISFSHTRFDLVTQGSMTLLPRILQHKKVLLPACCKDVIAGLCWAGDTAKLIAGLCCNEKALGEAYTLGTGEKYTWGEIADMYTEITGLEFAWIDTDTYLSVATRRRYMDTCILLYDRMWNRDIDNTKVLEATGLRPDSFMGVRKALITELQFMIDRPDLYAKTDTEIAREVNERIDLYLAENGQEGQNR